MNKRKLIIIAVPVILSTIMAIINTVQKNKAAKEEPKHCTTSEVIDYVLNKRMYQRLEENDQDTLNQIESLLGELDKADSVDEINGIYHKLEQIEKGLSK